MAACLATAGESNGKLNYCVEKVLGGEIPVRHCSGCGFDAATVMRLIRH
jgi:hypothetical protein